MDRDHGQGRTPLQLVGGWAGSSTLVVCMSLLARLGIHRLLGVYMSYLLASSVLCRLGIPFRRRGSGQERTPINLLFLRHNTSYLGMQVCRLFLMLAPERDEGAIEIHRREGEQSEEGF